MADNQKTRDGQPGQQGGQTFQKSRQDQLNQSYRDREQQGGGDRGDRDRTSGREQRGGEGDGDQNTQGGQSGLGGDEP